MLIELRMEYDFSQFRQGRINFVILNPTGTAVQYLITPPDKISIHNVTKKR